MCEAFFLTVIWTAELREMIKYLMKRSYESQWKMKRKETTKNDDFILTDGFYSVSKNNMA